MTQVFVSVSQVVCSFSFLLVCYADAVQVAWNTFKNSKDEDVLKLLNAYDPKEIQLNITKAEDDLKVLGLEEKNEKKINKALLKPHGPPNP
jgi:hypothetical protein